MSELYFEQILYTWRPEVNGRSLLASSCRDRQLNSCAEEIAGKFSAEENNLPARFVLYADNLERFVGVRVVPNFGIRYHSRKEAMVHVFIPREGSDKPENYLVAYPFKDVSMDDQIAGRLPEGPAVVPQAVFNEQAVMQKMGFSYRGETAKGTAVRRLAVLVKLLFGCMLGETGRLAFSFSREADSLFGYDQEDDRSAAELIWMLSFLLPYSGRYNYLHELTYSIDSTKNNGLVNISFSDTEGGIVLGRDGVAVPLQEEPEEFYLQIAQTAVEEGLEEAKRFIKEVMEDYPALEGERILEANIKYCYYKWKIKNGRSVTYEDIRDDFNSLCIYCDKYLWYREFLIQFFLQNAGKLDSETMDYIWSYAIGPNFDELDKPEGEDGRCIRELTLKGAGTYVNKIYKKHKEIVIGLVPEMFRKEVTDYAVGSGNIKESFVYVAADQIEDAAGLAEYISSYKDFLKQYDDLRKKIADKADLLYIQSKDLQEREKISRFMDEYYPDFWDQRRREELERLTPLSRVIEYAEEYGNCVEKTYFLFLLDHMIDIDAVYIQSPEEYEKAFETVRRTGSVSISDIRSREERFRARSTSLKKELEASKIKECGPERLLKFSWDSIRFPENRLLWVRRTVDLVKALAYEENRNPDEDALILDLVLDSHETILKRINSEADFQDRTDFVRDLEGALWDLVNSESAIQDYRIDLWRSTWHACGSAPLSKSGITRELNSRLDRFWKEIDLSYNEFLAVYNQFDQEDYRYFTEQKNKSYSRQDPEENYKTAAYFIFKNIMDRKPVDEGRLKRLDNYPAGSLRENAEKTFLTAITQKTAEDSQVTKDNFVCLIKNMSEKKRLELYQKSLDEETYWKSWFKSLSRYSKNEDIAREIYDCCFIKEYRRTPVLLPPDLYKQLKGIKERRSPAWETWDLFRAAGQDVEDCEIYFRNKYEKSGQEKKAWQREVTELQRKLEEAERELSKAEDKEAAIDQEVLKYGISRAFPGADPAADITASHTASSPQGRGNVPGGNTENLIIAGNVPGTRTGAEGDDRESAGKSGEGSGNNQNRLKTAGKEKQSVTDKIVEHLLKIF